MDFGINFLPDADPSIQSGQDYLREALDLCKLAEDLGYTSVKITEHYIDAYGGYCPSPIVFLASAAQRTRKMRLVTGCVLPVFTHPIKLSSELAMLDCICNGRLEIGIARAWLPQEFAAFNVSMDESRARFEESIHALTRLWTEIDVSFPGRFYRFEHATMLPRPVQSRPPIRIAVVMTPESFAWAGRQGYGLMLTPNHERDFEGLAKNLELYRQSFREAGHGEPGPEQIMNTIHVYVAEDGRQARQEARPWMDRHMSVFTNAARSWSTTISKDYRNYTGLNRQMKNFDYERAIEAHQVLIGNPGEVIEGIERQQETIGAGHISVFFSFGCMPYEKAVRNMTLFARYVAPHFAGKELAEPVSG